MTGGWQTAESPPRPGLAPAQGSSPYCPTRAEDKLLEVDRSLPLFHMETFQRNLAAGLRSGQPERVRRELELQCVSTISLVSYHVCSSSVSSRSSSTQIGSGGSWSCSVCLLLVWSVLLFVDSVAPVSSSGSNSNSSSSSRKTNP